MNQPQEEQSGQRAQREEKHGGEKQLWVLEGTESEDSDQAQREARPRHWATILEVTRGL